MSKIFNIDREPYNEGVQLYEKDSIEIFPGVTVLVGCNGAGKTTLLRSIEEQLEKENKPVFYYDNKTDGGEKAKGQALLQNNITLVATLVTSSEGEEIITNVGTLARTLGKFAKTNASEKELFILLDAIDSGLSIDNIIAIKEHLFKTVIKYNPDKDVYIIVSANSYEMAREEDCFDVCKGEYCMFNNYMSYAEFIIKSAKAKEQRYPKEG